MSPKHLGIMWDMYCTLEKVRLPHFEAPEKSTWTSLPRPLFQLIDAAAPSETAVSCVGSRLRFLEDCIDGSTQAKKEPKYAYY